MNVEELEDPKQELLFVTQCHEIPCPFDLIMKYVGM